MELNVVTALPDTGTRRRPLLFVHGAWHSASCWAGFLGWFADRGWESHALDLRGHGESPNDRSLRRTRIRHYVEDVAAVAGSMSESPIIIGHSMGGLIVQKYLEDHQLQGAVLLNPVPIGGVLRATLRIMRRHPVKFLKANLMWDLKPLIEDRKIAAGLLLPDSSTAGEVDSMWANLQGESYLAYLDMLLLVRSQPQLVHSSVAVVAGPEDRIFSLREHRKTAGAYGLDLRVVEGAAHDLMLGPNWEEAARVVSDAIEGF